MSELEKLTDEQVVETVRRVDKEVYAEIIRRYQAKLLRYAGYLLGDDRMGAEVVQEGFVKAYINLNGFDVRKKFSSWIYRIVHNEAMTRLRRQKKQHPMNERVEADSGVNIEDEVIKNQLAKRAYQCLEQMPVMYREVLMLYFLDEKSYEEISDILKIPLGTVGTRVSRAKGVMKRICQKQTN